MHLLAKAISWVSLVAIVVVTLAFLIGRMELPAVKWTLNVATVVWFVATPLWMERRQA